MLPSLLRLSLGSALLAQNKKKIMKHYLELLVLMFWVKSKLRLRFLHPIILELGPSRILLALFSSQVLSSFNLLLLLRLALLWSRLRRIQMFQVDCLSTFQSWCSHLFCWTFDYRFNNIHEKITRFWLAESSAVQA